MSFALFLHFGLFSENVQAQEAPSFKKTQTLELRVKKLEQEVVRLRSEAAQFKSLVQELLGPWAKQSPSFFLPLADSPLRGNKSAAITLVLFGDFESEYTARASLTISRLLAENPKKLRYAFKHFPLGQKHLHATEASLSALAAEKQGRFWEFYELLFSYRHNLNEDTFLLLAQELELDLLLFQEDRRSLWALERLSQDEKLALKANVQEVPALFLNGRRMPSFRYDFLSQEIQKLLP